MNGRRFPTTITTLLIVALTGTLAEAAADPFLIGQIWIYDHEGPRTGSMEPNVIDGQRILHVISVLDANDPQWVIEERFTGDPNVIGRLYVNDRSLLTGFDVDSDNGGMMALRYGRPVPFYRVDIPVGEEVTIETTLGMVGQNFEMGCHVVARRLDDQTISTPAGDFPDCQHYKISKTLTVNMTIAKVPMAEHFERWYSPTAGAFVKEIYTKAPVKFLTWSRPGYTATSTLKSLTTQQVHPEAIARADAAQLAAADPDSRLGLSSQAKALALIVAVVVLIGVCAILVKRLKR